MTNILHYPTTTSSNTPAVDIPSLQDQSILNPKSATIVIQHPSANTSFANPLLLKRLNPAQLGDILMKKIKSKTGNYDENSVSNFDGSSYQSPNSSRLNENLESNSMTEETPSPSIKFEEIEIPAVKRFSPVQTSLIVPNRLAIKAKTGVSDNQKQLQQALEVLQKKILLDQVSSLRDAFLREQLAQEPLYIPPLMSFNDAPKVQEASFSFNDKEDQPKVFIGPVEYPLLSLANNESTQKGSVLNVPSSLLLLNNAKMSTNTQRSLLESLCVTRAETQRSGSDGSPCQVNEEFLQAGEKKKRTRKVKENAIEKVKKTQKKEKKPVKGRGKAAKNDYLSESSQSP